MKKYILAGSFLLTLAFALLPMVNVYGAPVVISYENALRMVLDDMLPVRGADAQIREMQNQRDDLRDYILRIERNTLPVGMQDIINDLQDELHDLEAQLFNAINFQNQMQTDAELAMQAFIADMTNTNMLQSAIEAMVAAQGMGGTITVLEDMQRRMWREIGGIHDPNPEQYVIDGNNRNLNEMDRQIQGVRLQQDQDRLMRENALRVAIITLEELNSSINVMESGLALTEESLRQMRVMHGLGMVSQNELRNIEQTLALSRMELGETLLLRGNAQRHLNHLLGQPLSQHTIVEFERELHHTTQTVAQTQAVRQLELNVISARYALRNFEEAREREIERNRDASRRDETERVRIDNDRTRDALRENYNIAVAAHTQATQSMNAAILHGYNELERLQNRLEIQNIALSNAEIQLSTTQINLELGRATAFELEQAYFNVFMAEQAIETTINQKWLLAFTLENPVLFFQ